MNSGETKTGARKARRPIVQCRRLDGTGQYNRTLHEHQKRNGIADLEPRMNAKGRE